MSIELDRIVRTHAGVLLVHVRGIYDDTESEFEWFLHTLETSSDRAIRIIHLTSGGHKKWLRKFKIYGSPAVLIFDNGSLMLRIHGRISIGLLTQLLEDRVL